MSDDPPITNLEREYRRKASRLVRRRGNGWYYPGLILNLVILGHILLFPLFLFATLKWMNGPLAVLIYVVALVPGGILHCTSMRVRGRLVRAVERNEYRSCPRCGRDLEGSGAMIECNLCRASYGAADLERAWRATLGRFFKGKHYF